MLDLAAFFNSMEYMIFGMIGIFAVVGIIVLTMMGLRIFNKKQ